MSEMQKYSKSDQDPNQVHDDAAKLKALLSKKSEHFAMGTWIICNNVRGQITRMSKDGGTKLWIEWEDGTSGPIPNPRIGWWSSEYLRSRRG